MALKLDLTQKEITPLSVEYEPTGDIIRFGFRRVLNKAQRSSFTKKVGKGKRAREVADLPRILGEIEWIEGVEVPGMENGRLTDKGLIVKAMTHPENQGGMPEEIVEAVVDYILGGSTIGEAEGND